MNKRATRYKVPFHRLRFESPYALSGTSRLRRAYAAWAKVPSEYCSGPAYLTFSEFCDRDRTARLLSRENFYLIQDTRVIARLKGKRNG